MQLPSLPHLFGYLALVFYNGGSVAFSNFSCRASSLTQSPSSSSSLFNPLSLFGGWSDHYAICKCNIVTGLTPLNQTSRCLQLQAHHKVKCFYLFDNYQSTSHLLWHQGPQTSDLIMIEPENVLWVHQESFSDLPVNFNTLWLMLELFTLVLAFMLCFGKTKIKGTLVLSLSTQNPSSYMYN